MAWLNLNDSINSLKGQITNLATDLLSEGIVQSSDAVAQPEENKQLEELQETVASQHREIERLRKDKIGLEEKLREYRDKNVIQPSPSNDEWTLWNDDDDSIDSSHLTHQFELPEIPSLKQIQSELETNNSEINKLTKEFPQDVQNRLSQLQKQNYLLVEEQQRLQTQESEERFKSLETRFNELSSIRRLSGGDDDFDSKIQELTKQNERLQKDNQELVTSLNQLDLDCQQTTEKLISLRDTLQVDLNKIRVDHDLLVEKNQDLENRIEFYEKENKQLVENFRLLSNKSAMQADDNKEAYNLVCGKNFELEKQLEQLEDQKTKLQKDLTRLVKENEDLNLKNNELKNIENKYLSLQSEIEAIKNLESISPANSENNIESIQNLQRELSEMTVKFENILTISVNYKKQLTKLFNVINKSYKTKFTLTENIDHFEAEVTSLETQVERNLRDLIKSASMEDRLIELEEERPELIQNINELKDKLAKANVDLTFYKGETAELRRNNNCLMDDLKLLNQNNLETIAESNEDNILMLEMELEQAKQKIADLEGNASRNLRQRIQDLESDNKSYIEDSKKVELECNQKVEEFERLKKKLEEEKLNLELQLETYKQELEKSWGQRNEKEQVVEGLKKEIHGLTQMLNERDKQLEKTQDLIDGKMHWERRFLASAHQVIGLKKVIERLENQLATKEIEIGHLVTNTKDDKLQETLATRENQLKFLKERYQQLEDTISEKQCQIRQLSQSLESHQEDKAKLEARLAEVLKQTNADTNRLQDLENYKIQNVELTKRIHSLETFLDEQNNKIRQQNSEYEKLKKEFEELRQIVSVKHHESVNYHAEIQRLNHVIVEEKQKYDQLAKECQNKDDGSKAKSEIEGLLDKNTFLLQKCEVLTKSLLEEQSQNQQLKEAVSSLTKDSERLRLESERLRQHLLELEDTHTQEMLLGEQKQKELTQKLFEIEQRERDNSTVYTSVSIRANQQVETLHKQIQLANQQRDEYQAKLSEAEDRQMKQIAALTNLQCVLEQFQKDKDKDIEEATHMLQRELQSEQARQTHLRTEIETLKSQLVDTKLGLKAAARLQEQLEKSRHQVCTLKDEVKNLTEQMVAMDRHTKELTSQSESKVDKTLVKNLVIGYMTSANSNSRDLYQVVKVIGTVLDFSKEDYDKIHSNTGGSWLNMIMKPSGASSGTDQTSLSEAFIRFLENESKPKRDLPLLPVSGGGGGSSRESTSSYDGDTSNSEVSTTTQHASLLLNQVLLPTFQDFSQTRNSSSILKDVLKDNNNK